MLKIMKANIHKHKSSMITLFILISLTSMLLCIGLAILTNIDGFYENKLDELDSPHIAYYVNTFDDRIDTIVKEARTYEGISDFEAEDVLFSNSIEIVDSDNDFSKETYIMNGEEKRTLAPLTFIEEDKTADRTWVALPYFFKTNFKYKSGDMIKLKINEIEYSFTIKGFFEDAFYSLPVTGVSKIFLSEDAYRELSEKINHGTIGGKLISVRFFHMPDVVEYSKYLTQFVDELAEPKVSLFDTPYKLENSATTFIHIIALVLIGFSFIMVAVALIVITFSITTSVEDEIQIIGMFKAIGFKNSQIVSSILLQYAILAFVSSTLGLFIYLFLMKRISVLLSHSAGLIWTGLYSPVAAVGTMVTILLLVLLISYSSVLKTKRITPIAALRNGTPEHNFKRNIFPLEKMKGNINFAVILKSIASNKRQNISIVLITVVFTFAGSFSLQLYQNMILDNKPFRYLIGFPLSDLLIRTNGGDFDFDDMNQMPEVEKTVRFNKWRVQIEDTSAALLVSDRFDDLDKKTIVKGRYPVYDNEVSVSVLILKDIKKGVGDVIPITMNGITKEFLITGETQQLYDDGLTLEMTESGYKLFDSNYTSAGFIITLKEGVVIKDFIQKLTDVYGSTINSIDVKAMLDSQFSSFEMAITAIMFVVLLITVITIALVLFIIIRVKISRERINFGVYKSLGFTTIQIMTQIAFGFSGVIAVGAVIGGFFGGLYTNKMLSLLLGSLGISSANLVTNYVLIIVFIALVMIVSLTISMLTANRIKKITPYSLLI